MLYTVGVWSERVQKVLKPWHVVVFWIGLICDTTGTLLMSFIARENGGFSGIHGITGVLAIVLMIIHAVWATYVIKKNNQKTKETFHKFSIIVWLIWLIPYGIGIFMGMGM